MQRSLLIGAGKNHTKQVLYGGDKGEWPGTLTTMDMNPEIGADIVFDMDDVAVRRGRLPFADETFDEIGCYNAMEHWGRQGDWRGWFHECAEYWRIMKPGAVFTILVPIGEDALADPGHTRFFQANYFGFLSTAVYEKNEALKSCFTDYRWAWRLNFDVLECSEYQGHHLVVVLRKPNV